MTEKIRENINNPEELERLYRDDRKSFESGFEKVIPEIEKSELARFWKIRLDYEKASSKTKIFLWSDILILVVSCIISGFLIKIPTLFNIDLHSFLFMRKMQE